eukprot:TRINITY_DN5606_c0_g1_i1.p1 TRINITY_DN5606_c0_g1~~TRINITY_DN5606_c0_g1_i1.p1  ORF type:complete len:543 (-),score=89.49 TRINITY_DN5606_c0_g1_i1:11-1639(-)
MGERRLLESHFIELPDPCSVYSLARIQHCGRLKALVASNKSLYCTQIEEASLGALEWRTIQLPLIPEGADIISVDAFNQRSKGNPPVIGITLWAPNVSVAEAAGASGSSAGQSSNSVASSNTTPSSAAAAAASATSSATIGASNTEKSFYLYIYGAQCTDQDPWDKIASNRQIIKLDYVPFIMSHQEMDFPGGVAAVFLVSGSDNRLHLYKFVPESGFHELLGSKYLPTMTTNYPSSVISLDTEVFGNMGVLAVGCQDGTVQAISKQDGVTRQWSVSLDGPISSLKIYKSAPRQSAPKTNHIEPSHHPLIRSLQERIRETMKQQSTAPTAAPEYSQFEVNLIVGASIGYAIVFHNILEKGFSDYHFLPESDKNDAVLAVGLADADFDHDGHTEILVGTYGRKLLVYKESKGQQDKQQPQQPSQLPEQQPPSAATSAPLQDNSSLQDDGEQSEAENSTIPVTDSAYRLVWQRQFIYPILDFLSDDWTGDGINDLVVCSKFGLHLMQPDLTTVKDKALRRLRTVSDILAIENEISKLKMLKNVK